MKFDYGLILQTLTNLVDNALLYEPTDSQIQIDSKFDEEHIQIKVINHGETVTPEDQKHSWDLFIEVKVGVIMCFSHIFFRVFILYGCRVIFLS